MTTHTNDVQRKHWYPKTVEKQNGEHCNGCGIQPIIWMCVPPVITSMLAKKLFLTRKLRLDHIDNNPHHNYLTNFQLLCPSCNGIKNPRTDHTRTDRDKTPEMERRDEREHLFRHYWSGRITAERISLFEDLVASSCEFSDLALRTGQDIAKKLVSTEGWYKKFEWDSKKYVCSKDEHQNIIDDLEEERQKKLQNSLQSKK